jgi:hypothetical protein
MIPALAAAALLLPLLPPGPAAHTSGERPPESVMVRFYNPTGRPVWFRFIGTAPGADSPVEDWAKTMTADGFTLTVQGCGRWANPCVVVG